MTPAGMLIQLTAQAEARGVDLTPQQTRPARAAWAPCSFGPCRRCCAMVLPVFPWEKRIWTPLTMWPFPLPLAGRHR